MKWFSPGSTVSSIIKTDRHDITEIMLKLALNTINQTMILHDRNQFRNVFQVIISMITGPCHSLKINNCVNYGLNLC